MGKTLNDILVLVARGWLVLQFSVFLITSKLGMTLQYQCNFGRIMIKATKNLREINQELQRLMAEFSNSFSHSSAIWKNKHFLPPDTYTYMCVLGGKKYLFFVKFGVLCFLVTFVLRFALLLYCGQIYKNLNGLGLPKRTPKW